MQLVKDKFYAWYNYAAVAICFVYLVLTAIAWSGKFTSIDLKGLGFIPVTGVICLVQIIYGLLLYRREARSNPWTAGLGAAMILTLANISIIRNSVQPHSWFLIAWYIQILFSGMFGLYVVIGYDFLVTVYYILIASGKNDIKANDPLTIGAVLLTYLLSLASYMVWKRFYVDRESQKITQLTGLLSSKEQQSEILLQSISDGIVVIDTEGKINLLNPSASRMTGWPVKEAIGIDAKLVVKLSQEDGKDLAAEQNPFSQVLANSQQQNATLRLIDRNEKFIIVSLVVSPIILPKANQLAGCVAVLRDVSEARAEENRRADFISTASHEMRTPVAAIEGYLALALNEKVSKIDAKARDFLIKAHESTQHLGKLFQDLLTSAKAEDGRLSSHPQVVELGSFLQQVSDGLKFSAEKKGLAMDFASSTFATSGDNVVAPLSYVFADPDRLREVITNLFDNAVKYTDSGKVSIGLTANDKIVQFYVRDTGPGIPADDLPHLFQKFYRVDNTATRTIGGTGLGLFICKKIVELYGGRIWVESELGKGSKFYIDLPRLETNRAEQLKKAQENTLQV